MSASKAAAAPAAKAGTAVPAGSARRAKALDGKALAQRMERELAAEVARLAKAHKRAPGLAVVLVGNDPASEVYVKRKQEACTRAGLRTVEHRLPANVPEADLVALVRRLNGDATVDGILVQLPLPAHVRKSAVLQAIAPGKDVDAFHAETLGHALIGDEQLAPCTPQGILLLLDEAGVKLPGAEVCIVNHSNLIGKPLAALLINRDATVTVCHKHTKDLKAHTRRADIVVTATGVAGLITADHVAEGAVLIDVGLSRGPDGKLRGDCAESVWSKAAWVTPVPGGVGPMTIAVLLQNTVRAFKRHVGAA